MKRNLLALYPEPKDARRALETLLAHDFPLDALSLLVGTQTRNQHFSEEANKMPGGAQAEGTFVPLVNQLSFLGATDFPGDGWIAGPLLTDMELHYSGVLGRSLHEELMRLGLQDSVAQSIVSALPAGEVLIGVVAPNHERNEEAERQLQAIKRPPRLTATYERDPTVDVTAGGP